MDSVSQFVLGASVGAAVMGARTSAWRSVLWGGVLATLPDLDVLIDHGDPLTNMVVHRAESHSLFWLTVVSPLFAFAIASLHHERELFRRWCVAVWLALVTHPLLDWMTIYGTRLLLPFDDEPFGIGSLFVIDPLYTLPLLVGSAAMVWSRGSARGRRWNALGLVLSTVYAGWSLVAQQQALGAAERSLAANGVRAERLLATPAPLQTVLWRLVAIDGDRLLEGHWSLFDGDRAIEWTTVARGNALREQRRGVAAVETLVAFSHDFWKMSRDGDRVLMTDVRMGMEPHYYFTFAVGPAPSEVQRVGTRLDLARGLAWLWPRMWGTPLPSPR